MFKRLESFNDSTVVKLMFCAIVLLGCSFMPILYPTVKCKEMYICPNRIIEIRTLLANMIFKSKNWSFYNIWKFKISEKTTEIW